MKQGHRGDCRSKVSLKTAKQQLCGCVGIGEIVESIVVDYHVHIAVPTFSGQPRSYQGLEPITQRCGAKQVRNSTLHQTSTSGMGIKRRDRVITVNGSQGSLGLRMSETSCVLQNYSDVVQRGANIGP